MSESIDGAPRAPRYLRFITALVLGTAAATAVAACGGDDDAPPIDASVDTPIDANEVVDGPLPPPDLPRAAVA